MPTLADFMRKALTRRGFGRDAADGLPAAKPNERAAKRPGAAHKLSSGTVHMVLVSVACSRPEVSDESGWAQAELLA